MDKITFKALEELLRAQSSAYTITYGKSGKVLILEDNAETWFYFDKDDNLINIRSY